MKIAAITRFKHGALYELLKELGWTQKEFSVRSKIPYASLNQIMCLAKRPTEEQIAKMEMAFGNVGRVVDVASFFPDTYIGFKRALTVVQVEDVSPAQLESFRHHQTQMLQDAQPPLPADVLDTEDKLQQIAAILKGTTSQLSDRERDVIHSIVFKHERSDDIAKRYGVTRAMINSNYHSGLRKLRDHFEQEPSGIPHVDPSTIAAHSRPLTKEEQVTRWEEIEERQNEAQQRAWRDNDLWKWPYRDL